MNAVTTKHIANFAQSLHASAVVLWFLVFSGMRHVSKRYTAIVQIGEPHDMTKLSLLQICEELHVGIAFKVAKKVWVECLQVLRHLHGEVRGCNITGGGAMMQADILWTSPC